MDEVESCEGEQSQFFYAYGKGAQEVYTSESQDNLSQLRVWIC